MMDIEGTKTVELSGYGGSEIEINSWEMMG
jgi:hypothetical protein